MLKFNYEIKKYIYIYTYIYFKYVSSFIPIFPRMFIWKLTCYDLTDTLYIARKILKCRISTHIPYKLLTRSLRTDIDVIL